MPPASVTGPVPSGAGDAPDTGPTPSVPLATTVPPVYVWLDASRFSVPGPALVNGPASMIGPVVDRVRLRSTAIVPPAAARSKVRAVVALPVHSSVPPENETAPDGSPSCRSSDTWSVPAPR